MSFFAAKPCGRPFPGPVYLCSHAHRKIHDDMVWKNWFSQSPHPQCLWFWNEVSNSLL